MSLSQSPLIESGRVAGSNFLRIKGSSQRPLVVVIPGNPGLCEYYDRFLVALAERLPGYEIVVASHLGFDGTLPTVQSLDVQVAHQLAVIDEFGGSAKRKVIVLGHSVGSWISQRVALQLKDRTLFVGLLAPTVIDISQSDRGIQFTRLASNQLGRWFVLFVAFLASFIPAALVRYIVTNYMLKECSSRAQEASVALVTNRSTSRQLLVMAFEEMHRIGSDIEPPEIKGFWSAPSFAIWVLFAEVDHWVSGSSRIDIIEQRRPPQIDMQISPRISHAWCLHDSNVVAEKTVTALRPFL